MHADPAFFLIFQRHRKVTRGASVLQHFPWIAEPKNGYMQIHQIMTLLQTDHPIQVEAVSDNEAFSRRSRAICFHQILNS